MVVITVVMIGGMCFAQSTFGAAIGNTVWHDRNANGVQDAGEEGIPGVKLKLYNGDKVKKDKTNAQGRYKFKNLDAGHYTVVVAQETLPKGCYATYDRDGNKDGWYKEKYLKKDQYYRHIDFGYRCVDCCDGVCCVVVAIPCCRHTQIKQCAQLLQNTSSFVI